MSSFQSGSILSGSEALNLSGPVRHIVALPYTSNLAIENGGLTAKISRLSEIAVMAAAVLWQHYPESRLVIAGETDYHDQPGTADLMREHILAQGTVSANAIDTIDALPNGRPLDNTYLQMKAIAGRLGSDADGTIFAPLRFHLPRVAQIAEAYGVQSARFVAAEDIHTEIDDPNGYEKYFGLIDSLARSEKIKRFIGHFDRHGFLFTQFMRVAGPNLDDIREQDGVLSLERGSAWAKEKQMDQQLAALNSGMRIA